MSKCEWSFIHLLHKAENVHIGTDISGDISLKVMNLNMAMESFCKLNARSHLNDIDSYNFVRMVLITQRAMLVQLLLLVFTEQM